MKNRCFQFAGAAGTLLAIGLIAGCSSVKDRHVTARTEQTRHSMVQANEGYDTLGRRWDEPIATPVREAVPPEPRCAFVSVTKHLPDSVGVGEEYPAELTVSASEQCGNVVVTENIPEGVTYLRSDPNAQKEGNHLLWKFPSMKAGETKNMRAYYKAEKVGELGSCATVSALPQACASTMAGKPDLVLTKTGPETSMVGNDVAYTNTILNKGTLAARNVVLTDKIPEGLVHASGKYEVTFDIGDLAPNQSRAMPIFLKATKRGKVCNTTVATSVNGGQQIAEACTLIQQPGLAVLKSGDKEQYLTRRAAYTIVVTNTGDTALQGVVVTDTAPEPTSFVSAEGAIVEKQNATWIVSELPPGQAQTFKAVLTSRVAGKHENQVVASAGNLRQVAQAATEWRGLSALLIEAVDDHDPVQVGETTTYTIRVTNQGTADESNVGLVAKFTDQVKPVSGEGLTVEGQTMSTSTVPKMAPKETITYKITVQGAKEGDARLRISLTADGLDTPVIEEESTRVY